MQSSLVLGACILLSACSDKSSADKPPAHAPVSGPAMYTTKVVEITVQEAGKGDPRKVEKMPGGTFGCRVEKDPGSELVTGWFEGSFNERGKSTFTHEKDATLPVDVVSCLMQPAINTHLGIETAGEYRVTVKAYFTDPKPQPARPG